jgi:hypothetical protein
MAESCAKPSAKKYQVKDLHMRWEVYYDGDGDMFFKGGWPRFAEDYDLHQGWFLLFDYHCGTTKFNVKIFDGTQCQKKYEAEVYFH